VINILLLDRGRYIFRKYLFTKKKNNNNFHDKTQILWIMVIPLCTVVGNVKISEKTWYDVKTRDILVQSRSQRLLFIKYLKQQRDLDELRSAVLFVLRTRVQWTRGRAFPIAKQRYRRRRRRCVALSPLVLRDGGAHAPALRY